MENNLQPVNLIKESKPQDKNQSIAQKLKEDTTKFFKQMKVGCGRKFCYNLYCARSKCLLFKQGDKEIISESIKLAKLNNCEKYFCRIPEGGLEFEEFILSFTQDNFLENNFNQNNLLLLNLDFNKLNNYYSSQNCEIEKDLKKINLYFSSITNYGELFTENSNDKNNIRLCYFIYYIYSSSLLLFSLNPNFCYLENLKVEFITYFENFTKIKNKIKNLCELIENESHFNNNNLSSVSINNLQSKNNTTFLLPFEILKNYKNEFSAIINNFQNFLALLLFQVGEDFEDNFRYDDLCFKVLIKFMKIFNFFYQINEKFSILNFRDFYNDSVSNYLNLKEECQTYISILNKKNKNSKNSENKPFSLIKYHFLFDAAAKSDILYIFNFHKQRQEMMNSISDIMNLQMNYMDMRGIYLFMEIRRSNLIEDTLNFISNSQLNFKKQLKIKFTGEQGVDEGGVKKEFFLLLIRQLFDPDYGMFLYNNKNRFFWFNSMSFEPNIKFELIGVILGLAFFNNVILDIKFPLVIYKKILSMDLTIEDLNEIDPELYNNLKYLINTNEKNLKEKLDTNFTVIVDQFGEKTSVPLKEGGEDLYIDENNKEEYVKLYLDWYFNKSIENVFTPFKKGFYRMLRPEELELIICGTQNLNFAELEKSAKYDDGYTKDSQTIKNFWEVVHSLTELDQKKFLLFLTGCDRAPINGLGSLVITITRFGPDSDKLPCAHTCFNHLLLPDYENKEKLKERLVIAIGNAEGFGLM